MINNDKVIAASKFEVIMFNNLKVNYNGIKLGK